MTDENLTPGAPPSPYEPVPVLVAKAIADQYRKTVVVIMAHDPVYEMMHTTTYGVGAFEKEQAAMVGEICAAAVGGDLSRRIDYEDFHKDMNPALFREAKEILQEIYRLKGTTAELAARIARWCRLANTTS